MVVLIYVIPTNDLLLYHGSSWMTGEKGEDEDMDKCTTGIFIITFVTIILTLIYVLSKVICDTRDCL